MRTPKPESDQEPALDAARATLLALKESHEVLARSVLPREVLVPPATVPVSWEEAAAQLAAMPKPVICNAELRSGRFTVDCRTMGTEVANQARIQGDSSWEAWSESFRERFGDRFEDQLLLLRGELEEMYLRAGALREWFRDYSGPWSLILYFEHADITAGRADAVVLVTSDEVTIRRDPSGDYDL